MTSRAVQPSRSPADDLPLRNDEPADWQTCSVLGTVRGIPWWAAVVLATAFAGIGVFVDLHRLDQLGLIFQVCYFTGCLLAVLWVQRRGLFGPMVQPPLILAVAVPGVVLANGGASGAGMTAKALALGTPLINGFPTMALTTGCTLLVGALRLARQRPPRAERTKSGKGGRTARGARPTRDDPAGRGGQARPAGRRPADDDHARPPAARRGTPRRQGQPAPGQQRPPRQA